MSKLNSFNYNFLNKLKISRFLNLRIEILKKSKIAFIAFCISTLRFPSLFSLEKYSILLKFSLRTE